MEKMKKFFKENNLKSFIRKPHMRHIRAALSVALLLTVAVFLAYEFRSVLKISATNKASVLAQIQGLLPGEHITYTLQTMNGKTYANETAADENGIAKIDKILDETDAIIKTISLETQNTKRDSARRVHIAMKNNNATQETNIHVSGLPEFSDSAVTIGSNTLQTRTDWSGNFNVDIPATQKNAPITIAMPGHTMGDLNLLKENPMIVKVLDAPGGGGPTDEGVNDYSNPDCDSDGEGPDLSTCDTSRMDQQLENIKENYIRALMMMTEQFTAVMMQYTNMMGMFFDAKQQLETQQIHQKLVAQAHKDYHPSEQMCQFGSYIKSIGKAEQKMAHEKQAVNKTMMEYYTNAKYSTTNKGYTSDMEARLEKFKTTYCDTADNNNGLRLLCGTGGSNKNRLNKDVDYSRTVGGSLTLDVNFMDGSPDNKGNEEDVIALAKNLYWVHPFEYAEPKGIASNYPVYMDARRIMAIQNIAHNSYAQMVAMKSESPREGADKHGARYMKALMKEFGLSTDDIHKILGDYPSYWAQMEFLTKKLYQLPDFYTNLIDKPANVKRINATLDALKLMQDRDWHETSMRQEMLSSMLVEMELEEDIKTTNELMTQGSSKNSSQNPFFQ